MRPVFTQNCNRAADYSTVKGSVPENRKIRFDKGGPEGKIGRMARQLRIEYAGAMYHVMARGNQGRPIFDDNLDRRRWLQTLGEACEKTGGGFTPSC
jgi:hypothetical protein